MSNLVQAAEELEYVPKEELVRMMEQGDMKYPPYLVLSEIQRRTQLENMVMQPKPNTTVAQEVVSEFAQPQGLAGMPQGMSTDIPLPPSSQTVYEDRGIPASGLAAGGYLRGGKMEYTGPTIFDEEGNELDGLEALRQSGGLNKFIKVIGMKEGGLLGFNTGADTTFASQFRNVVSPVTGFLNSEETTQFGRIISNPALRQTFTNLYNIDYLGRPGGLNTRVSPEKQRRSFLNTLIYSPENLKGKIEEYNELNKDKKDFTPIDFDALGMPTPQAPVSGDGSDSSIFKAPPVKEDPPKTTEEKQNITDMVKGQMGKFGLSSTASTPPSEEQRNREKQALIFSTLAKNIGSATNLSGIGEGFADATALAIGKSAADRKEDAEFLKSKRADVVSEIQIISSLQDIGARIRSNDIKERQIAQENAKLLLELLQDPTISLDPEKTKLYLGQLESYLSSGNAMASPSTGIAGVNFTK